MSSYAEPDLGKGTMGLVAVIIGVILLIALCGHVASEGVEPMDQSSSHTLVLHCGNAAQMHKYGLPTAEDAMHYKTYGAWGYREDDGDTLMFNRLPGGAEVWYDLYSI